jgi:hypothetical protein
MQENGLPLDVHSYGLAPAYFVLRNYTETGDRHTYRYKNKNCILVLLQMVMHTTKYLIFWNDVSWAGCDSRFMTENIGHFKILNKFGTIWTPHKMRLCIITTLPVVKKERFCGGLTVKLKIIIGLKIVSLQNVKDRFGGNYINSLYTSCKFC